MPKLVVLPLLRELVRTYQAFERLAEIDIRHHDLTMPQFDVLVTLGNSAGMSFKQIGEKTLITKGTLTGVVSRLLQKGLVTCTESASDRRSKQVCLSTAGEQLFLAAFEPHMHHLYAGFGQVSARDRQLLESRLRLLREHLIAATTAHANTKLSKKT